MASVQAVGKALKIAERVSYSMLEINIPHPKTCEQVRQLLDGEGHRSDMVTNEGNNCWWKMITRVIDRKRLHLGNLVVTLDEYKGDLSTKVQMLV